MTNQNSSSGSSSMAVPEAKAAMNRFKEEVASELGVPLKDGYNGDLTFEIMKENRPERTTNSIYSALDFDAYLALALERAKKFAALVEG